MSPGVCLQTFSLICSTSRNIIYYLGIQFIDRHLSNQVFTCDLFIKQDILMWCWHTVWILWTHLSFQKRWICLVEKNSWNRLNKLKKYLFADSHFTPHVQLSACHSPLAVRTAKGGRLSPNCCMCLYELFECSWSHCVLFKTVRIWKWEVIMSEILKEQNKWNQRRSWLKCYFRILLLCLLYNHMCAAVVLQRAHITLFREGMHHIFHPFSRHANSQINFLCRESQIQIFKSKCFSRERFSNRAGRLLSAGRQRQRRRRLLYLGTEVRRHRARLAN